LNKTDQYFPLLDEWIKCKFGIRVFFKGVCYVLVENRHEAFDSYDKYNILNHQYVCMLYKWKSSCFSLLSLNKCIHISMQIASTETVYLEDKLVVVNLDPNMFD